MLDAEVRSSQKILKRYSKEKKILSKQMQGSEESRISTIETEIADLQKEIKEIASNNRKLQLEQGKNAKLLQ